MSESEKNICPKTAHLLTILGQRHVLLLLHTLTGQPLGFNDLQEKLDINTATLSDRLRDLEKEELVEKRICSIDSRHHYYSLTKRGKKISTLIRQF